MKFRVLFLAAAAMLVATAVSAGENGQGHSSNYNDAVPLPGTAGARALGAAFAAGAGNNTGYGLISIRSRSFGDTNPLSSAATSHGIGKGAGASGKRWARTRVEVVATVRGHLDKNGNAIVGANARALAAAKAHGKGKGVAQTGITGPLVHAQAKGGAHPSASTAVIGKNGVVVTQARAKAGVGATASGGKTVITHFGPHKQDTLAITYTPKAYSAAVATPKTATAYSGYAAAGQSFKGANLIAAIQLAAYAYATAGNNYAIGRASANGEAAARSSNALAYANVGVYAEAFVSGDTVILKAGKAANGVGSQVVCVQQGYYHNPEITLTCRSLPIHAQPPIPSARPAHRLSH